MTILVTAFTPEGDHTTELLDGLYKNAILYGFSLVMSAVIQTIQKQLDLYHAIFVMQIIFSLDFVYAYGMASVSFGHHSRNADGVGDTGQRRFIRVHPSERDFRMKVFISVQTFSTVMFTVWLLYVWIKDRDFGSQPQCNHLVKYVLLFADVRVTVTWLRVLFIMYLVITACTLLFRFAAIISVVMENLRKDIKDKVRNVVAPPGTEREERREEQESVGTTTERRGRTYVHLSVL